MAETTSQAPAPVDPETVGLHSLAPAPGAKRARKRIGRGHAAGGGKTAGRGHKGYGSRAGSKDRPRFEGGQNPLHMRMRKLRGPNKKMSMPFEPFRTVTQHVNLDDLEARFDAGAAVDVATMQRAGLATRRDIPVKVLGRGELSKALTVSAHAFSKGARAAIEGAGGTCVELDAGGRKKNRRYR
jgi:large subunit ribosomal protein L15